MELIKFADEVMDLQVALGGQFVLENPRGSDLWRTPTLQSWYIAITDFQYDNMVFTYMVILSGDRAIMQQPQHFGRFGIVTCDVAVGSL